MSIILDGGVNPSAIVYNGTNLSEVYYNGTKVWPDEEPAGTLYYWIENNVTLHLSSTRLSNQYTKLYDGKYTKPWDMNSSITTAVFDNKVVTTSSDYICFHMFAYLENLTHIYNIDKFDTTNSTDMSWMFAWTPKLENTNEILNALKTKNVKNFDHAFSSMGGEVVTSLDVSKLNTSNAEDMTMMFMSVYDNSTITKIYGLTSFNTSKVKNMYTMFGYLINLEELDLSSFNTKNVEYNKSLDLNGMNGMFGDCKKLEHIYVGDDWDTSKAYKEDNRMFLRCYKLPGYTPGSIGDGIEKAYVGPGGYLERK